MADADFAAQPVPPSSFPAAFSSVTLSWVAKLFANPILSERCKAGDTHSENAHRPLSEGERDEFFKPVRSG